MKPLHRKLGRDILHLRGQLAAVALVVAAGVSLFVTLRSMHGYLTGAQADYYRQERFAELFDHLTRAPLSLVERLAGIEGVAIVEPRIVADVLLDVPGLPEPATGRLVSVPGAQRPALNDLYLRSGRYLAPGAGDEVIASDAFARANHLKPGDTLGAVIHGRWQQLRIVGTAISPEYVYEIRGTGDIFPDNRRFGVFWMDRDALSAAFDLKDSFNDLSATLAPGAVEPDVLARLDKALEPYGGLGAYGREDHVSHRFVTDEIAETQVTSLFIPSIFLLVTAFLIHLVLSRLVGMQRDQIAVLKAFGYTSLEVAVHYLELAMVPVGAGAVGGVGLGIWFARGLAGVYARFYQFPRVGFTPDVGILAAGIVVALGAAALGSLSAVRRAMALAPAEAMRPEPPPRFRAGWLEETRLWRLLSPGARTIVRHLGRRPLRALLSIFAIALAVSIVVAGRWGFDAVDWIRRIQFENVQREDVSVILKDPRSSGVLHELQRLPGVIRVEPFRVAPARIRNSRQGNLVERVALLGLSAGGDLRRIVDSELRSHAPPSEGVLLTSYLARRLRVRPGDPLTVEFLERTRRVRQVRVAGLVDEVIGTSATMSLEALHRMLGEGEAVSGAFLSVDRSQARQLYARLKRIPGISTVAVREAAVRGFERTIAESFLISIIVTIGAACVIAFGMVYNGARIALSERGRELASLRVLGFSRREVAGMLLGEQALLTLLALPAGFVLGYGLCALMAWRFRSELFRIPLVISGTTLAFSTLIILGAAVLSGLAVRQRLYHLDLIEVLKTRE
jgi:putative ABC transport system permease protein